MTKPTYLIDAADERGVPVGIRCDQCDWTYTRADDDPDGELLALHAHHHSRGTHSPGTA